ncbi:MAG: bifunctional phosphopantothenoylcysteine decarboxylase/phosphopantothenate--cysteine ligase CoaBC [Thermoprotei archaeon]
MDYLKDIVSTVGDELKGRRVALCITGSVSAYKAVDIARLLMRHGAEVLPVLSRAALKVVTPDLFMWATGNKPVTQLTGAVEHVGLAGRGSSKVDAVVVAPCTANTISKIANGVDDTPVTSVVSVALGSGIPVVVVPAMHEPMYNNPFIRENLERLRRAGVRIVEPNVVEGKAKLASGEAVLHTVAPLIGKGLLRGRRLLVTAGPTREHIDPIRVITNPSSGKMGYSIASKAKLLGAEVTLVSGPTQLAPPPVDELHYVETTSEMLSTVVELMGKKSYDIAIFAAAPSDYTPLSQSEHKISTREQEEFVLKLKATPKVIVEARKMFPSTVIVGFKAEYGLSLGVLIEAAKSFRRETQVDVVVANDAAQPGVAFGSDTNQGVIVGPDDEVIELQKIPKAVFAEQILTYIARVFPSRGNESGSAGKS